MIRTESWVPERDRQGRRPLREGSPWLCRKVERSKSNRITSPLRREVTEVL